MNRIFRLQRWRRRTRWMAGQITRDLGLGGPRPPIWRRDNPFFWKTLRSEARRPFLYLRLLLTLITLSTLLLGGLAVQSRFPFPARMLSAAFGVPIPTLFFLVVSLTHTLFVLGARAALGTSLAVEVRRQTLDGLLLTPPTRAEMLLAMTPGPAVGAGMVALAGLPVYVLINQVGGVEWQEVGLLYALFFLMLFAPPTYALPALSGAAATPETPGLTAGSLQQEQRKAQSGGAANWSWLSFIWIFSALRPLFSSLGGGWVGHLSGVLPPTVGRPGFLLIFSWPYFLTQVLGTPLEFYRVSLAPIFYVLPLAVGGVLAGTLKTAAALEAGSAAEMTRLPLFRRHAAFARLVRRIVLLCAAGFVWKAWILGGDTSAILGDVTGDPQWGAAGLLLLLGSVAQVQATLRAGTIPLLGKTTSRLRPPGKLLRRTARVAWRPIRLALGMFVLMCLFGALSPFGRPSYEVLGRLSLVGLASLVFLVGLSVWAAVGDIGLDTSQRGKRATRWVFGLLLVLFVLPFAALSAPTPALWKLAAISPATAWAEQFYYAQSFVDRWPYWTLGQLPPFWLCIIVPLALGLLLGAGGYARAARRQPRPVVEAPGTVEKEQKPAPYADRTRALLDWVTARTDNPLFTHELRVRTRSGLWFRAFLVVPSLLLIAALLGLRYPDILNGVAFTAAFHFFRYEWRADSAPALVFADIAAVLQSWQIYLFAFSGQVIGENLILRDLQRGTLGFTLLTPLRAAQIFWGKIFGNSSVFGLTALLLGAACLLLSLLSAPAVGLGPALIAWAVSQLFALSLFLLGTGLGAAFATHAVLLKSLRGVSTLLLVGALIGGGWLVLTLVPATSSSPFAFHSSWQEMVVRLLIGALCAAVVALPAFAYGLWRLSAMRRKDIAFGDGAGS